MFLHTENQQILWQTLQKSPYFIEFTQKFAGYREEWFRGIVNKFFTEWISNNGRVPTNARELLEINKLSIKMMILDLKRVMGYIHETPSSDLGSSSDVRKPYNVAEERKKREDEVSAKYNKYQSEYNQLLKKPELPMQELPTEFANEKIQNMEELVKEHERIRNMDLAIYSASDTTPSSSRPNQIAESGKIKIMDEIKPLPDIVIPIMDYNGESSENTKHVHWEEVIRDAHR